MYTFTLYIITDRYNKLYGIVRGSNCLIIIFFTEKKYSLCLFFYLFNIIPTII